ncbi:co-chaperone GroES [Vibrio cholerae]|nr:co-chaperone GroES [Vibrio cholerae]
MKLRPLHDWVVIERKELDRSLLMLPNQLSNKGDVIAVGSKVKEIAVGDVVQFNRYAGLEVSNQGNTVIFINEAEILVILETC